MGSRDGLLNQNNVNCRKALIDYRNSWQLFLSQVRSERNKSTSAIKHVIKVYSAANCSWVSQLYSIKPSVPQPEHVTQLTQ